MNRAVLLAAVSFVVGASACNGCKEGHPYVPYAIDEAGAVAVAEEAGTPKPLVEGGVAFAEQGAVVAPADATDWTIQGIRLVAPPGKTFALGLARDFDGDGAIDALAVVQTKEPVSPAELLFYRGQSGGSGVEPGVPLGTGPALADPSCSPTQRLGQIGKHSVFVELGQQCAGHAEGNARSVQLPRANTAPSRWAAVVSLGRAATVHLSLMVVDPPNAPLLTLSADGSDYDGDGIDDVALTVTLEGGGPPFEPGPRVSAVVRWVDRRAGMSRAPDQPEASLHALVGTALARAAKAKDAPTVPILVRQIRALYAAICGEGGAPRLTHVLEATRSITCGASSHALEEAGLAEVRALATMGDVLGADAALDRAQVPPASRTASRGVEAQGWIAQAAPAVSASSLRVILAIPAIERAHAPSWGALAFEPDGKLLVRTSAGVVRVDPTTGDEADASGVIAWRSEVTAPDGKTRWTEAYDPCDAFAVRASFAPTDPRGGEAREVALPLAARLGARCADGKGDPVPAVPLGWGATGLEALVAGQPVLVEPDLARATPLPSPLAETSVPGASRSPDGRTLVVPTSQGIVVRGARTRSLRAKELEGAYLELRDCAVSNDAARVACVRGGRAFVGIWNGP